MQFQKAQTAELEAIMEIIRQAQARLKELGVDQWQDGYPDAATVRRDIAAGEGYVLCEGAEILAFAAISFAGESTYDRVYDGAWHGEAAYAVLHRLAANGSFCRRGIGSEMIRQTFRLCLERDVLWVRVDTHQDNLPMQKLLAKNGFQLCGTILLESGAPRLAFDANLF